jgi:hypothetical protein
MCFSKAEATSTKAFSSPDAQSQDGSAAKSIAANTFHALVALGTLTEPAKGAERVQKHPSQIVVQSEEHVAGIANARANLELL